MYKQLAAHLTEGSALTEQTAARLCDAITSLCALLQQQAKREEQIALYEASIATRSPAGNGHQQPQPLFPDRMTLKEAKAYTGVSVRTLNYERAAGRLHALKVGRKGRKVLLEKKELDAWLKGQRE